jgi:hypothetical protein
MISLHLSLLSLVTACSFEVLLTLSRCGTMCCGTGDKYRVITNEQQLQDFRRVASVTLLAVFPSEADENYGKFLPMIDDIRAKFPVAVTTTEAVITSVHYLLLSSVEGFPKDEVANVMFVLFKPESDGSFAIWSTIK